MQIEKSSCQTAGASASTSSIREQLIDSLKTSKEYRHSFLEEKIRTGLAAQIKAIREQREGGMTQKRFAEILGKSQSWIARLEDPNAEVPTLSTLLQVAYAFDVDLEVRFAPFSELVDWVSGTPHWTPGLSSDTLAVEDFQHDLGLATQTRERTVSFEGSPSNYWAAIRAEEFRAEQYSTPVRQTVTVGQIIQFSLQRGLLSPGQVSESALTASPATTSQSTIPAPPSQTVETNYAAVSGNSR
jgi:transcriptional regulator with XRE-family HTH domain